MSEDQAVHRLGCVALGGLAESINCIAGESSGALALPIGEIRLLVGEYKRVGAAAEFPAEGAWIA